MSAPRFLGVVLLLTVVACSSQADTSAASGSALPKGSAAAAGSGPPESSGRADGPASDGDDRLTEADFEEEAEEQIDSSNMEGELSRLEKEIAADR